jgi:predicted RNase H-like nuclease
MPTTLCGIDGCKGGWLSISVRADGDSPQARMLPDAVALLQTLEASDITAIDIPIGLPSSGVRQCDIQARALLGRRRSSVFPAPLRCTLETGSYADACLISRKNGGKALSKQAHALLPKIRDVDNILWERGTLAETVFEVHPEVSFCLWNSRKPMEFAKQSGFGFVQRLRLTEQQFGDAAREIRRRLSHAIVSDDDILDALAALWTARRIHAGHATRLGAEEDIDTRGLRMQMFA